ncbi:MAG: DUF192 domain-containing protein [Acidimicrobiales bacterium]
MQLGATVGERSIAVRPEVEMAWLLRRGEVLASVDVSGRSQRARGVDGVTVTRSHVVHTFGARCALDVAYLSDDLVVLSTRHLARGRVGAPALSARLVLRAASGSFERWSLRPGDELELKE